MIEHRQHETTSVPELISVWTGAFVAFAVIAMAAVMTYFVLTHEIPQNNQTIVGQLMGSLLTSLGVVVGFFFVASAGNRAKDRAMESMAKTAQQAQAALPPVAGAVSGDVIPVAEGEVKTVIGTANLDGETP